MTQALLESVLKELAPELSAGPLYIVFDEDIPELSNSLLPSCAGMTSWNLHFELQSSIKPWRGPGPAMLISSRLLGPEADRAEAYLGVAIHELGHILVFGPPWHSEHPKEGPTLGIPGLAEHWRDPKSLDPECFEAVGHHGLHFIRAIVHLNFRAKRLGYHPGLSNLFDPECYKISSFESYESTLSAEVQEMVGADFETIIKMPMPPDLLRLHSRDLARRKVAKSVA